MSEREVTLQRAHEACLQGDYQRAYEMKEKGNYLNVTGVVSIKDNPWKNLW